MFKPLEDATAAVDEDEAEGFTLEAYEVKTPSVCRFKTGLWFISMGKLFWNASQFVGVARKICKAGCLNGCSEGVCATYARIIFAWSYQAMFEIPRDY